MEPKPISSVLNTALRTLVPTTPGKSGNTDRARKWIDGCGWGFTGAETPAEKEILTQAYEGTVAWLAAWLDGGDPYWLVLTGYSGVGKTLLVRRICEYVDQWGKRVYARLDPVNRKVTPEGATWGFHWDEVQWCAALQKWPRLVPHSEANQTQLARARKSWVLAIDDLKPQTGAEAVAEGKEAEMQAVRPKPFEVTAAADLLDDRLRHWTIVTSNLTRKQLAVFWDIRIASRLTRDGNVLVDLSGVRDYGLRREAAAKK